MSEKQRINIRTTPELRSLVKAKAAAAGKTMNEFVIEVIEAGVRESERARAASSSKGK